MILRSSAVVLCTVAGLAGAGPTYFDGTFAPADWSSVTVVNAEGAASSSIESQFLSGGNAGSYMRIELNLVANAQSGSVWSLNTHAAAFYDPGSQGPITVINYSEDSRNFMPASAGNVQGTGLLIQQGGKTYVQRNPVLVMPNPTFGDWAPNTAPGLVAIDLWEITPTGGLISSSNPDFSAAGGIMQLGFWRGGSSGNFVGTDFRDAGIDNWCVEIVPAPSSAALLALGGCAAGRRCRR